MKLKIGWTAEDLVQTARDKVPKSLKIIVGNKTVEVLNADGSELTQTEQDAVKNYLINNFVRSA